MYEFYVKIGFRGLSLLLLIICLVLPAKESNAQVAKLYPVDEAAQDPSFLAFRDSLLAAVEADDTTAIIRFTHQQADNFYLGTGFNTPYINWVLQRDKSKKLFYSEIKQSLLAGGTFKNPNEFQCPYVFSRWPEIIDPFHYLAVIKEAAFVREYPNGNSALLDTLSYDIVEKIQKYYDDPKGLHAGWAHIRLADNREGYIKGDEVISPLGMRFGFVQEDGIWLLKYATSNLVPPAPRVRLVPVDEARKDSSFSAFRENLLNACERTDTAFVFPILDNRIRPSFGGGVGVADFIEYWNLRTTGRSNGYDFWQELKKILNMGGAFRDDSTFVAPYVSAKFPLVDDYNTVAITGDSVKAYESPDSSSNLVKILSYDIVLTPGGWYKWGDWIRIRIYDGSYVFVPKSQYRSPTGYRAHFVKREGKWIMKFFIAGD